ncbi:VOC family protein [Paucibacter sp. AS339]|uniref:VOC family protein n=1 Tax=Paucibacter hankyongi TaxID=3133434 RepID=UPI0030964247
MQTRITGIGGIFIKSQDPERLRAWYREHLGIDVQAWGGTSFAWQTPERPEPNGSTIWSIFDAKAEPDYFAPSKSGFMVNYRVDDLEALLSTLRAEGCEVDPKTEVSEFGKFGWVMDPDGHRVELWEPPKDVASS